MIDRGVRPASLRASDTGFVTWVAGPPSAPVVKAAQAGLTAPDHTQTLAFDPAEVVPVGGGGPGARWTVVRPSASGPGVPACRSSPGRLARRPHLW